MATLGRRTVLAGSLVLLAGCSRDQPLTAASTPTLDAKKLGAEMPAFVARAAPGVLGFGLMNLDSGEHWTLNGDRPFPMQSVFKAPLVAAALSEVDLRRLSFDERLTLKDVDLSPGYSPIAEAWPLRRDYTVGELISAVVIDSDNTAADALMDRIGGPGVVSAWLTSKALSGIRVDRYEREIQTEAHGMASFRPEWRGAAFGAAMATVPPAQRMAAMRAYMADPRDTATPRGMLDFLSRLDAGELLSPSSTQLLVRLMLQTTRGNDRIRAGLPSNWTFAHRAGTAGADLGLSVAFNDVGIAAIPKQERRSYAVAAFLSGSTLEPTAQAALFADLGRLIGRSVG